MDASPAIIQVIETHSIDLGLDPTTILGIIKVESNYNPLAIRFEKNYRSFFRIPFFAETQGIDTITEQVMQAISWGLMQLMGANARALGYNGFLPELSDPETGLMWGMKFFKGLTKRYDLLEDQLAAYNHGHVERDSNGRYINQVYVDDVMIAIGGADVARSKSSPAH